MTSADLLKVRSPTLLVALIGLLIAYPQLEGTVTPSWLSLIIVAVLVSAVYAVGTNRKHLVRALILAVPAVTARMLLAGAHPLGTVASNGLLLVFLLYVVGALLAFLLRPGAVDFEKLTAAASLYLLLGLTWTIVYKIVELRHPGSLSLSGGEPPGFSDLMYFSYVTLTTLGYGDITPVSDYARSMAMIEAMTGTFFVAVLVARLVSMYGVTASRE